MATALETTRSLRLPAATVLATFLSTVGLNRLIDLGPWLSEITLLAVLIAATGVGMRAVNAPRLLVVPAQLVVIALALTAMLVPHAATAGFLPGPGALRALGTLVHQGGLDLGKTAPPAASTVGITALLTVSGAGFALLMDLLAVTLRRPVLTGLPMLAIYLIPATRQPGGMSWLAFAAGALGYLVLLGTDGQERLSQWGRAVQRRTGRPLAGATNTGLTRQIAAWAIGCALVIPMLVPSIPRLITLNGGGGGGGSGKVIFLDQSVDISKDLATATPEPMFSYRTDAPADQVASDYLQMTVLTEFNGDGWGPPSKADTAASGTVFVPGLKNAQVQVTTVHTRVTVTGDFGFSTVPAPYADTDITAMSGLGDIEIDKNTGTVFANDNDNGSRKGARYTAVSKIPIPTAAQLATADATAGETDVSRDYLYLPDAIRSLITAQAQQITANASTPYAKALALQKYFLNPDNGFRYSLNVKLDNSVPAIESFLKNKSGFCEQYAATMAAMARSLGIPAVVATGFTYGEAQPDGSYQVTTHDAHAWPLLYFDGFGWIRFEPTPGVVGGGRASAPPWTVAPAKGSGSGNVPGQNAATGHPTPQASAGKCANGSIPVHVPHNLAPDSGSGGCGDKNGGADLTVRQPFASWGPLGVVPRTFERWFLSGNPAQIALKLLLLGLILLTGAPGLARFVRRRHRRKVMRKAVAADAGVPRPRSAADVDGGAGTPDFGSRFGPGGVRREAAFTAWAELREYATDLGFGWPDSDTPRELAGRLAAQAAFDEASEAAVGRVTTLVELAVYSPDPDIAPEQARRLPDDVRRVRSALGDSAGRGARLRAAILPSSSLDYLRRGKRS